MRARRQHRSDFLLDFCLDFFFHVFAFVRANWTMNVESLTERWAFWFWAALGGAGTRATRASGWAYWLQSDHGLSGFLHFFFTFVRANDQAFDTFAMVWALRCGAALGWAGARAAWTSRRAGGLWSGQLVRILLS